MEKYRNNNGRGTSGMMVLMVGDPGRGKMARKEVFDDICNELHELEDAFERLRVIQQGVMLRLHVMMMDCDMIRDMRKRKESHKENVSFDERWNRGEIFVNLPMVAVSGTRKCRKGYRFRCREKGGFMKAA